MIESVRETLTLTLGLTQTQMKIETAKTCKKRYFHWFIEQKFNSYLKQKLLENEIGSIRTRDLRLCSPTH